MNLTRVSQLTPRKKLYDLVRDLKKTAAEIDRKCTETQKRLKMANQLAETQFFAKVNATTANFLLSQIKMQQKQSRGRRYSLDDKIFPLSIMKQSPKGYRFLKKVFALPSRKTLMNMLRKVPFTYGINEPITLCLKESIAKMNELDRYCILMFDEISIEPGLTYLPEKDRIDGFQCYGDEVRTNGLTDHVMVFMAAGVRRKWKQPIAYFYTQGT